MRKASAALVLAAAAFVMAGCDSPQHTLEEVRFEVGAYTAAPNAEGVAKVDEGFERLDRQIAALQAKGKAAEARALREERDVLKARYAGARVAAGLQGLKHAAHQVGEALRQAGETLGGPHRGTPAAGGEEE